LYDEFPKISFAYVNVSDAKKLAAQNSVFTAPTIVFFFDGKESLRKSRNINLYELKKNWNAFILSCLNKSLFKTGVDTIK